MTSAARWLLVVLTACSVVRAAMVCGQVVCVTEAGHYAVEAPHRPGHCPDRGGDEHDRPCEDRPAAGGLALQAPYRPVLKGAAIDVLHAQALTERPALRDARVDLPTPFPAGPPADSGRMRTVVLLI